MVESAQEKEQVFAMLDKVVEADDAVLASNTSSIPIMRLAMATSRPEAVIGIVGAMASVPRDALTAGKRALLASSQLPLRDGLRLEAELFLALIGTEESRERQARARARYAAGLQDGFVGDPDVRGDQMVHGAAYGPDREKT